MTSKLVVNTIEADTGISSVSFASSISMSSTSVFHFSDEGLNIGADTNISRLGNGILGFKINGAEKFRIDSSGHIKAVGVCTATHFYGDGSNLTGITGTTINNNANDKIITGSSSANTLEAASAYIDSNGKMGLGITSPQRLLNLQQSTTNAYSATGFSAADNSLLRIHNPSGTDNSGVGYHTGLEFVVASGANSYGQLGYVRTGNNIGDFFFKHRTGGSSYKETFRVKSNGAVGINTDNFSGQLNNEAGLAVHGSSNDNCRISITTPSKSNSRIGYFGLNRFGIDVHYGLEVRDAESSYATRFKIDNNGYVTMNQPYGYVRFNTISDTGGENRQTNVNTATVENGMSHSGGRLTVPTAGKYYIGIHGNILDNNNAAQYLYINGSKQAGWNWQQNDSSQYWKSSMVGGVVSLSANDYLDIYVVGQQDNHSWNMWTVYMLG